MAFSSTVGFSLANDNCWHNLLSEFWLTLLDRCKEKLTDGARWQSVKSGTNHSDGNHVEVLGTGVITAVHDTKGWQTGGDLHLGSTSSSSSSLTHPEYFVDR